MITNDCMKKNYLVAKMDVRLNCEVYYTKNNLSGVPAWTLNDARNVAGSATYYTKSAAQRAAKRLGGYVANRTWLQ